MAHQRASLVHDKTTSCVFDMSDAGTGKTFVRIAAFVERRRAGGGKLLVLCTRTLMRNAWAADFAKFAPTMKVSLAPAEKRDAAFDVEADAYIVNHDGAKWLAKQPASFFKGFDELVIDESTAYKHHTSQRSKAAAKIAKHFKRRSCLTATPTSNGICDIWHQVYLLDGGKRLGSSFYKFRDTVCEPVQVGRHVHAVDWRDKPGAEDAVFGLIDDIVIRHRREDCVDIPDTHYYTVPYELTAKQRRAYADMEVAQLLWLFDTKNKAKGKPVATAVNAAAVATKLLQISSGSVYGGANTPHLVDLGRYEQLLDMVEERVDRHPLVFFYWQHQAEALRAEAAKRKLRHAVLDGNVPEARRAEIVTQYQAGLLDVVFAHPVTTAHGLTMTRGSSIIWTGPTYNLEWFKQGSLRQARIGQKRKTEIVTVVAENTIEEKVYAMMHDKNVREASLLDLFASLPRAA